MHRLTTIRAIVCLSSLTPATLLYAAADPQVEARAMVTSWPHPLKDPLRLVASPLKLSATPVRSDLPPPLLGEHTAEVLGDWLAHTPERLSELRARGIV